MTDTDKSSSLLPDRCPDCGTVRETRKCDDCDTTAVVIDCGHYKQPTDIAVSAYLPYFHVCDACEATREGIHAAERLGQTYAAAALDVGDLDRLDLIPRSPLPTDYDAAAKELGRPLTDDERAKLLAAYVSQIGYVFAQWGR